MLLPAGCFWKQTEVLRLLTGVKEKFSIKRTEADFKPYSGHDSYAVGVTMPNSKIQNYRQLKQMSPVFRSINLED